MFGAPNGLCSSITESKHIKAVKEPWRRSNRYNALGQMLLTNQRLDKLAASQVDFIERGMLSGNILSPQAAVEGGVNINSGDLESNPVSGGPPTVTHVQLARTRKQGYARTLDQLVKQLDQPRLVELVQRFLYNQQHLHDPDAPCTANVALSNCPAGSLNAKISVFHSATAMFYAPSDESGLGGMH
ncbi:hypothetical protein SERLADRAFT_441174 [Serpula lacrymans var. lacrymans S7.9]|uniref:Uncharacterized protein n=1 Tax=Serpula lacrymans var. lacrymans (strain S7.9) TaxID=578457 RepID=F8P5S5_SERL9|nr:uncharacterized protein SERLADRAFT_441174 [Serpula lacrymans var. lacrymans S7.9]EGO21962.1 hypothetical protein SERLADRAFT_441174 [Serpula lacrymans var. lacrymans S7.9]